MTNTKNKHIIVLGGGPAGLCVAWNLTMDGYEVTVLEKKSVCGGQSLTFEKDGFRYDLGPHNIHSKFSSIIEFLARNLGTGFKEHQILPKIYFRGKFVDYPLVGIQVLQSVPLTTSLLCGMSFVWCRLLSVFLPGQKDDGTYEKWIINRFGRKFYNIFFGPYSEKAWGIPPSEISEIVAKKRIAIQSLGKLVRSVLFNEENYHPENPRIVRQYYTQTGVGEVCEFFEREIIAHGGCIENGVKLKGLELNPAGDDITGVTYSCNGEIRTILTEPNADFWQVISTIPVNDLILNLRGRVPSDVVAAAEGLDFTSEIFLYLTFNEPDVWDIPLLYFSEKEFPFNRAYDIGLFSRDMVPEGKNAVCLELTCSEGDETWNMSSTEIFQSCIEPLEKHGLLQRSQVESYHIRKLKHAYPRFRVGYERKIDTILQHINAIDNLVTFGRQGLFTYANVDDVIRMAFEIAKHLNYQKRLALSTEQLLPDYINR